MSLVILVWISFFLYYVPRLCLLMEVKFYKSTIRIRIILLPVASGWAGRQWEKSCLGYISETVICRKFILDRDIAWG